MLLQVINRRRTMWRKTTDDTGMFECHPTDSADVVVVDYDLLQYSNPVDTTGSRMAYLLRCFSKCGIIIVLNEVGVNVFDLSLSRPTQGFADIYIGDMQLGNVGLWKAHFNGYRPWYWPVITEASMDFERCVIDVQENLDIRVIEFLGLERVIDWIPRRARDFLSGKERMEDVTFREFVASSIGGIAVKDRLIPELTARVAAARIRILLNSIILPDQGVLVDAPHLAHRFPSLIANHGDDIATWNRLCVASSDDVAGLLAESLDKYRFKPSHWLWRPAWFWPEISKDEDIEEVKNPWTISDVDWVFCEDLSQFLPVEHAQDVRAIVSPPFIKRFLFNKDSPDARRYLRQSGGGGPADPLLVEYLPQAAFSL